MDNNNMVAWTVTLLSLFSQNATLYSHIIQQQPCFCFCTSFKFRVADLWLFREFCSYSGAAFMFRIVMWVRQKHTAVGCFTLQKHKSGQKSKPRNTALRMQTEGEEERTEVSCREALGLKSSREICSTGQKHNHTDTAASVLHSSVQSVTGNVRLPVCLISHLTSCSYSRKIHTRDTERNSEHLL